jgi:type III restriction enzyme
MDYEIHDGELLSYLHTLYDPVEKKSGYDKMIGNIPNMYNISSLSRTINSLYIPLRFFFCRSSSMALPLISLMNTKIKISVKLSELKDILYISSGSEISKLQEVGRGLRLPVNEYGNRVKDEQFYLNYFVDFTESDFVDKLVNEINQKSGAISREIIPDKLSDIMIKKICELYETTEDELLEVLDSNNVVTRTNSFKTGGFDFIKQNYPKIFEGVNSNKVRKATDPKKKVVVRTEKYQELKDLWEKLNEKVILEYKFDNEANFKTLFTDFLKAQKDNFTSDGINERISKIEIKDNRAVANEPESVYNRKTANISIMKYSDFLKELSKILNINIKTLHQSIIDAGTDINKFLNQTTLRVIKQNFDHYLMANAIDKFSIEK